MVFKCKINCFKWQVLAIFVLIFMCLHLRKWHFGKANISSVNLKYVTVHFDLKGSPPTLRYLKRFLPKLEQYGVNSILMEYEDMFPYEGRIANLSAKSCYKKNELKDFLMFAKEINMEIIPLVQTFGHMEHALKLREFMHLREVSDYPDSICPSDPESIQLIKEMLKQVLHFHNSVGLLKYIHIGCDEVYSIKVCKKCRMRELDKIDLFLDHVQKVQTSVTKLSPHTKVLQWDDMMRQSKPAKYTRKFAMNVEPVVWDYTPERTAITSLHLLNLHNSFKNIWIATAFKGADGPHAVIPNIRNRFLNHINWLKNITNLIFAGETEVYNFEGIIVTGWSRYSHMQPQCELLPIAMPSLILNLLLINTVRKGVLTVDIKNMTYCFFYNKYLREEFEEIFVCEQIADKCSFENNIANKEHKKLFDFKSYFDAYSFEHLANLQCGVKKEQHPKHLRTNINSFKKALIDYSLSEMQLRSVMNKYYSIDAIQSYINENINVYTKDIQRILNNLEQCSKVNYWEPRS